MKAHIYFIGGPTEDHFKLELLDDSSEVVDTVLDQLNLGKVKFITPDQYQIKGEAMKIELMDGSGLLKIGELECKSLYSNDRSRSY